MKAKELELLHLVFKYVKPKIKLFILSFTFLVALSLISLLPPYLTKLAFDEGVMNRNLNLLTKYVLVLIGVYILKSFLNYLSSALFTLLSQNTLFDIKKDLTNRILKLPLEFFSNSESGYIVSRFKEADSLSSLFSLQSFKLILSIFEFIGAMVIMFSLNVRLTLLLILVIPIFYLVSRTFESAFAKVTSETMEKGAIFHGKFQQSISGAEEIKRMALEEKEAQNINEVTKEYVKSSIKYGILLSFGSEAIMLLSSLVSVLLLYLGGQSVIQESISIGTYMAFTGYFGKLYAPVVNWSLSMYTFKPAFVALERIRDFFMRYPEEDERSDNIKIDKISEIEMRKVRFCYPDGKEYVLRNFNLKAEKGDKVLLKGPNGSGKSTVIRLLLGFYENYEGEILINGLELNKLSKKSLRTQVSIVSQKIFLFNDTIENNIKIVGNVNDEKYKMALNKSGLKDFVESLPLKDQTLVGENGVKLSGGQIQKLAIARAIMKSDSDVFIFDEATAHLDKDTRELIKKFIKEELNDKICIIIDHSDYFDDVCNKIMHLMANHCKEVEKDE
ncbi:MULTISPECIES: ABC transporter ATP-binding protein [Thermoanaerobacter]|uniref:ABC-type bacteriocin/lantibiotic exporter with double-glycine peptidase domain n=1 Tax=Thermoanaerobacter pentosaceus TaxID=694059 RepID=A0ABT9M168_9THEO|nr:MULTISPECIES: ABC transporter ATP-binding protein [Thermoanaerobacter]MDP9749861.1 ABC-type bacteriocin/lantibiotic exporter with double-glycine peptidase domain [Thermoanaerobacter pentosaceus]